MKNAIVILLGLVIAGTAGSQAYRLMDSWEPMLTEQVQYPSSALSSLTPLRVQGMAASAPEFTDYEDGMIGNGKGVMLYFRSSSDGSSVQSDRELIMLYSAGKASISTYRVDYDIALTLERKYDVSAPNTFVLLDGKGNIERSVTDPAPEVLEGLVR